MRLTLSLTPSVFTLLICDLRVSTTVFSSLQISFSHLIKGASQSHSDCFNCYSLGGPAVVGVVLISAEEH